MCKIKLEMVIKSTVNCRRTPKSMRCFLTVTDGFCLLVFGVSAVVCCQPPDRPDRGYYVPAAQKYQPGDKVSYFCRPGSSLIGKEFRTCQFGGKWTDETPFCDLPVHLKRAMASSSSNSSFGAHRTIDANESTCISTKPGAGEYFRIFLDRPSVVYVVRVLLQKGDTHFSIYTERYFSKNSLCSSMLGTSVEKHWVTVSCPFTSVSDAVYVVNEGSTSSLEICEVQLYVKGTVWCPQPPRIHIPNGYLDDVSREKATLQCNEGFRPGTNRRLVCNGDGDWNGGILMCEEILCDAPPRNSSVDVWSSVGNSNKLSVGSVRKLKCPKGYGVVGGPDTITCRSNGTWSSSSARCEGTASTPSSHEQEHVSIVIIASAIVSIVLLVLFVVIIFLIVKRRLKPVVVVLKQGDNAYSSVGGTESECSSIVYDATVSGTHRPRQHPRPKNANFSESEEIYASPENERPPTYDSTQIYAEVRDLPARVNHEKILLENLKNSPVYKAF